MWISALAHGRRVESRVASRRARSAAHLAPHDRASSAKCQPPTHASQAYAGALAMVAAVDARRPVDRAALGQRAGRPDLSAGGPRRGGLVGPRPGAGRRRRRRRWPTISSSPRRSTPSASTASTDVVTVVVLFSSRWSPASLPPAIRAPGAACRSPCRAQRDHRRLRPPAAVLQRRGGDRARRPAPSFAGCSTATRAGQRTARAAHRRRATRRAIA